MSDGRLREQHEIVSALARAAAEPARVFAVIARELTFEEMVAAIGAEFDLNPMQAVAVANLQVRYFSADHREPLAADLAALEEQLAAHPEPTDSAG